MNLNSLTIYTPVDAQKLKQYLIGYHDAEFVSKGFLHGFSLGLKDTPTLKPCTKKFIPKKQLVNKIQDEVAKGRIIGPVHEVLSKSIMVSPVQVIPKADSSKLRMIFNLSQPTGYSVNDNIDPAAISVSYCSVTDVVHWIMNHKAEDEWFMAKADLTDAYRMVPITDSDWKHLGMQVGQEVYVDRCLPMGAASSCSTFQRISDALTWISLNTCPVSCMIYNYLDDFLVLADGKNKCEQALSHFEQLCKKLNIPISAHKTVRPTTNIIFLGLGINSQLRTVFIPAEKASKTLQQLKKFLGCKMPRVHDWQSILGKLSHLTHVIPAGRTYLSSVYASLQGILSQDGHHKRLISAEAKEDLLVWQEFLTTLPPTRCFRMYDPRSISAAIFTDASSSVGYGATMGESWFMGKWPKQEWNNLNITLLELYPIYAALHTWTKQLSNTTVKVYTDNKALVAILNKLYTKDKMIRQLLKPVALWCLSHNVWLIACHIPGLNNVGPDLLSRGKVKEFLSLFPMMKSSPDEIPIANKPGNLKI